MTTHVNTLVPSGATPRRIDFATFVRLAELGIYPTRSELIDGIVYDRNPKGDAHYLAQSEIVEQLVLAGRGRYRAGAERTLKINDRNGPMPDTLVTPRYASITSERADLVIEVADSSLDYDRTGKRALYASVAVPEYWVVDLQNELVKRYLPASAKPRLSFARATRSPRTRIPTSLSTSEPSSQLLERAGKRGGGSASRHSAR